MQTDQSEFSHVCRKTRSRHFLFFQLTLMSIFTCFSTLLIILYQNDEINQNAELFPFKFFVIELKARSEWAL